MDLFYKIPPTPLCQRGNFNIGYACTDAQALQRPDTEAIIVDNAIQGTQSLTYAQLAEWSSRFGQLLSENGLQPGDRVLIRLPNCLEFPIAFFGTLKHGAIAVPSSPLLSAEELHFLLCDSGATAIVTTPTMWQAYLSHYSELPPHLRHVFLIHSQFNPETSVGVARREGVPMARRPQAEHQRETRSDRTPKRACNADSPAYLVYTSGTTAYPKGVLHAHRALLGRQPASTYWLSFHPGDRVLHTGKFNWTYTLGTGLMDPLYRGLTTIVHEGPNDPSLWMPLVRKHQATHFISVPAVYRQILHKTSCDTSHALTLRHCMSAGEHLSQDLFDEWKTRFGIEIREGFGMTECSYYLSQRCDRPIRPGSTGFPQPGHDIALLSSDLKPVPTGTEGIIAIPDTDSALFLRYWNQSSETGRQNGYFLTGDYAIQDEDGYIWFTGRHDDLINSFGYRISPYEIERVLKEHPAVADAAAVGEELEAAKVLVVAHVILREGQPLSPEALIAYCKERLATYKQPKKIYFVADFPRTRNGKIIRNQLKAC